MNCHQKDLCSPLLVIITLVVIIGLKTVQSHQRASHYFKALALALVTLAYCWKYLFEVAIMVEVMVSIIMAKA